MKGVLTAFGLVGMIAAGSFAYAQGAQTGTITGTVQSPDGLSLPGVTVTAASPVLQGQRTSVSDVNGVYFIKGLPAGTYTVTFELQSFRSAKAENVQLNVGATASVSQTLSLGGVVETVEVKGDTKPLALTRP